MATADLNIQANAKGFEQVNAKLDKVASATRFTAMLGGIRAVARVGKMAFGALANNINEALSKGADFAHMAHSMGTSAGEVRKMAQAFKDNGASVGEMQVAMKQMLVSIGQDNSIYKRLGLDTTELKAMSMTEQFETIAEKIRGLNTQAERSTAMQAIFGRGAINLGQVINTEGVIQEAEKVVGSMANVYDNMAYTMEAVGTKFGNLSDKQEQFWAGILNKIAPVLNEILDRFTSEDFVGMGERIGDAILPVLENFTKITGVFRGVIKMLSSVGNLLMGVGNLVGATITGAVLTASKMLQTIINSIVKLANWFGAEWSEVQFKSFDKIVGEMNDTYVAKTRENFDELADKIGGGIDDVIKAINERKLKGVMIEKPKFLGGFEGTTLEEKNVKKEEEKEEKEKKSNFQGARDENIVGGSQFFSVGGYATGAEASLVKSGQNLYSQTLSVARESLSVQKEILQAFRSQSRTAVYA